MRQPHLQGTKVQGEKVPSFLLKNRDPERIDYRIFHIQGEVVLHLSISSSALTYKEKIILQDEEGRKALRGEQLRSRLDQYLLQDEEDKRADNSSDFKAKGSGVCSQEGSSLEGSPWVKEQQMLPGVLQKEKDQGRISSFPVACAICIRFKPPPISRRI